MKKEMKKKVAFYGGYTLWSAGDDAPLDFLVSNLRDRYGDIFEFTVFARHPNDDFNREFGVKTINNFEYSSKLLATDRWLNGLNFTDSRDELEKLVKTVSDSDAIVLGAGNFLTEVSLDVLKGHFAQFAVLTLIADITDTPCFLFGLSANYLNNPWSVKVADWMLRRASYVTFREYEAIKNLKDCGVNLQNFEVLPDAALGAPSADVNRGLEILNKEGIGAKKGNRLALSLRDMSWKGIHTQYEQKIIDVVNEWCKHNDRDVICIPQCSYLIEDEKTDDRYIARLLKNKTDYPEKIHLIEGRYHSRDVESLYRTVDISLATRLHGCVFSAKMNTPVVGISYEDKVKGFFGQIGMPDLACSLEDSSDVILNKLEYVLKNREDIKIQLKNKISDLQHQVLRYVDILADMLKL